MGLLCCELDGGMGMIQIFHELQGCFAMALYGEDIVNIIISPPYEGLGTGIGQELLFQLCHEQFW